MQRFFFYCAALIFSAWIHTASAELNKPLLEAGDQKSWLIGYGRSADANYLLGAGDVLKVSVYSNPDLTLETRVTEGGLINFPLIGEVSVGGITPFAAEKRIEDKLEKGGFILKPQVNILVTQFQSKLVAVLGSVSKPGRYPIERATSLADLLALVGGITPDGSEMITVTDKTGKTEYDLRNIVGNNEAGQSVNLTGGEVVYVARAPIFYIYGEVQRPGSFRIERNMTIIQALAQGGGPTVRGTQRNVKLHRRNAKGVVEILSPTLTDAVKQDDVIYIQESLF